MSTAVRLKAACLLAFTLLACTRASADVICCNLLIVEPGTAGACRTPECCEGYLERAGQAERARICKSLAETLPGVCPIAQPFCDLDCAGRAKRLRDLKALYDRFRQEGKFRDSLEFHYLNLKWEWELLKMTCPDIGNFDPGVADTGLPSPPPPLPALDIKTPAGANALEDHADKIETDADWISVHSVQTQAACDFLPSPSAGGGIGIQYDLSAFCGPGLADLAVQQQLMKIQAKALRKLARDPASPQFREVPKPNLATPSLPRNVPPLRRSLLESSGALRRATAYLDAYTTSHERYQGARAASDVEAMQRQARAMIKFALGAQAEGEAELRHREEFKVRLRKALDEVFAAMTQAGRRWQDAATQVANRIKADGLSAAVRDALVGDGSSAEELEALRKRFAAVTVEGIELSQATERQSLDLGNAVRELLRSGGFAMPWPHPVLRQPSLLLEYHARRLQRENAAASPP